MELKWIGYVVPLVPLLVRAFGCFVLANKMMKPLSRAEADFEAHVSQYNNQAALLVAILVALAAFTGSDRAAFEFPVYILAVGTIASLCAGMYQATKRDHWADQIVTGLGEAGTFSLFLALSQVLLASGYKSLPIEWVAWVAPWIWVLYFAFIVGADWKYFRELPTQEETDDCKKKEACKESGTPESGSKSGPSPERPQGC